MRACVLALVLAGCGSGRGPSTGNGPAPSLTPPPAPAPSPTPAGPPGSDTSIVLVRHTATSARAQLTRLDVAPLLTTGAPPAHGPSFDLPMVSMPWDERRFVVLASQDGDDLVVASLRIGSGPTLVHQVAGRTETRELELVTRRPTALLVAGGVAYVGAGDTVGFVELRAPSLRFTAVHQRTLAVNKAFDLIVKSGDWLVAVDDQVMPMWADSFSLDDGGRLVHRAGWELPGVINGHYALGALLGVGGDGTLVLGAPYSILDGHGHDLVALAVRGHALAPFPEGLTLQNARGTPGAPPVLEEHVPRGRPAEPPTLRGGTTYSEWASLVVRGADLLLAAGERGLMVLPVAFMASSTASLVDVGGHCLDVVAVGDALVALVGDAPPDPYAAPPATPPPPPGPSRLVVVRREGATWRPGATHALDGPYTRFVPRTP